LGGIHGAREGVFKTEGTKVLRSLDVASFYPNMAISQKVYPAHLGLTFCKVYEDLYNERKKHPKGTAANAALKLSLNGTYGDSNNEFSPLYDPAYTMTITVGGQLSLCMLMEKLIDECFARIVMCNTDGFEYIIEKSMIPLADELTREWEKTTGLEMEGLTYSKMMIADVNSYVAIKE
jgi:DNA polymerase elongation subunit (family B)